MRQNAPSVPRTFGSKLVNILNDRMITVFIRSKDRGNRLSDKPGQIRRPGSFAPVFSRSKDSRLPIPPTAARAATPGLRPNPEGKTGKSFVAFKRCLNAMPQVQPALTEVMGFKVRRIEGLQELESLRWSSETLLLSVRSLDRLQDIISTGNVGLMRGIHAGRLHANPAWPGAGIRDPARRLAGLERIADDLKAKLIWRQRLRHRGARHDLGHGGGPASPDPARHPDRSAPVALLLLADGMTDEEIANSQRGHLADHQAAGPPASGPAPVPQPDRSRHLRLAPRRHPGSAAAACGPMMTRLRSLEGTEADAGWRRRMGMNPPHAAVPLVLKTRGATRPLSPPVRRFRTVLRRLPGSSTRSRTRRERDLGADDPFQLGAHQCLPLIVVFPPAGEQLDHAGRHLRVEAVEGQHLIRQELVAGAAEVVKAHGIAAGETADQGVDLVRVPDLEGRMRQQGSDFGQRFRTLRHGLDREPLVDHQRLVLPGLIEAGERSSRCGRWVSFSNPSAAITSVMAWALWNWPRTARPPSASSRLIR